MTAKADLEDLRQLTTLCSKLTDVVNRLTDTVDDIADSLGKVIEDIQNLGEDVAILQTDNPSRQIESLKDAVAKHTDIPRWQLD